MMIEVLTILTPILMLFILLLARVLKVELTDLIMGTIILWIVLSIFLASVGSDKKDTTGKTTCIKCDGAVEVEK